MIVLVPVVMIVAAAGAVLVMMVIMLVSMAVIVAVGMPMVMAVHMGMRVAVALAMAVSMAMMVSVVVVADMGAALRPEGALHGGYGAALPACQLRQRRIALDVEGIIRHLDEAVIAAEMPGEAHEAQGVLGLHLEQGLRLGLHLHQLPVLEPQGIAVVDGGFHVEIEMDLGAALGPQGTMATVPRRVVEGDGVDDAVGLHGGLADDGGDAGHGFVSVCDRLRLR